MLQSDQGDLTSPEGWCGCRNPIRYTRASDIGEVRDSGLTDLAGFLLKLDFTRNYTDGTRTRFRSLTQVGSSRESLVGVGPGQEFCTRTGTCLAGM